MSLVVLALPGAASAQLLGRISGEYDLRASASLDDLPATVDSAIGTETTSTFYGSVWAWSTQDHPVLGKRYSVGSAALSWKATEVGPEALVSINLSAFTETGLPYFDESNRASSTAKLALDFDFLTDVRGFADSSGTANSDLYRWDGNEWQPIVTGLRSSRYLELSAGRYRWAGATEAYPGLSLHVDDVDFSLRVQAVPEPTSLAVLGLGGLALLRRRRIR